MIDDKLARPRTRFAGQGIFNSARCNSRASARGYGASRQAWYRLVCEPRALL